MKEFSFERDSYRVRVELKGASSLHIPGRDGVMLDGDMPVGESWHIGYPTDLNAQFILAETQEGWIRVGTKYRPLHFTQVNISRLAQGFEVKLELQPWSGYSKPSPPKLFGDYAIFCGHLSIPVPFPGRQVGLLAAGPFWDKWWAGDEGYRIVQEHYDRRGAIKTLRLNLKDFGLDEETRRVIEAIKS